MNLQQLAALANNNVKTASVKSAAVNTGSTLVMPYSVGNHGSGFTDTDPNAAVHQRVAETRALLNRQNYLDTQEVGTNFVSYGPVLNQADQTIAYTTNPALLGGMPADQMGGMPKTASAQDQWLTKMASTGLFKEVAPDSPETFEALRQIAMEKTASDTKAYIGHMLQNGMIEDQEIVAFFMQ